MSDLAAALSAAAGRTITFENETLQEAYTSRGRFGAPRWELDGWVTSLAGVAAGELDVLSDTVERLAGRPPLTFEEFLAANPPG